MKRIKKFAGLMLAMIMALAMTMTAFANANDPVNVPTEVEADLTGHTYTAYQIFAGTQTTEQDSDYTLATIRWGSGIDAENFLAELKTSSDFGEPNPFAGINYVANDLDDTRTGNKSATDVAAALAEATRTTGENPVSSEVADQRAQAFAKIADKHLQGEGEATVKDGQQVTLNAGYYLIVDTTDPLDGENAVRNVSVLQLTKRDSFVPRSKTDVPEVTKKVKDKNDSTGVESDWQDRADYDIGDHVPFILTGTLPTDYARYTTYKYIFHDEQAEGLEFDADSIVVKLDGTKVPEDFYEVVTTGLEDDCTFEVRFDDLKVIEIEDTEGKKVVTADSIITVEYTAELTEAVATVNGITNSVKLEYSNNSNFNGSGETGTTPEDVVTVFTYNVVASKTDENNEPLEGAAFTLYRFVQDETGSETENINGVEVNGDYEEVEVLSEGTEFTFKGIDAGLYKLAETVVPNGYNRAEDIKFIVEPEYNDEIETPTLIRLVIKDFEGKEISGELNPFTITLATATTEIQNLKGSLLPSTGGIGTTIFYVVGGILVIGAGILLVVKKRMGARD